MKKQSQKNKSSLILAIISCVFLIAMHLATHIWGTLLPFMISEVDAPATIKAVYVCDEKFPSYFNPFQKPTYTYCFYDSNKTISEEAESFAFYSNMKMITEGENIANYYQGFEVDGMSLRTNIPIPYLNPIYFLFQYTLLAAFIFFTYKFYKSK